MIAGLALTPFLRYRFFEANRLDEGYPDALRRLPT
jgi:hypothetical protein